MTTPHPFRTTLHPHFASSGTECMFLFFTGAVDLAYVGLTPFLLGRAYGLPVRIVALAQRFVDSHGVVLRNDAGLNGGALRLGTVFGSSGHHVGWRWAQQDDRDVMFVSLSPSEQAKAFEYGFVDGVACWGPHLTRLRTTGNCELVYTSADDPVASYNLLCASDQGLESSKRAAIDEYLRAHVAAVDRMLHGDTEEAVEYLGAVFEGTVDVHDYERVLHEGYEWPDEQFTSPPPSDHPVWAAIESAATFLEAVNLVPSLTTDGVFPEESHSSETVSDPSLRLGYSDSLMCAPFFVGQGTGLLAEHGFDVARDDSRVIERIARFDEQHRTDLKTIRDLISTDPELATVKAGRINERLFTKVYEESFRQAAPRRVSSTITKLEEADVIPQVIATSANWIRSIRNVAAHDRGVRRSQADKAYQHLIDILEWHHENRDRLGHRCMKCAAPIEHAWKACPRCGTALTPECPSCQERIEPSWQVCPYCTAALA